jgi:hypothetical protein
MGWTVWGSNPGGGEIFRTCPDRPWGPPSLLYDGYRLFSGGKVQLLGLAADHSPPSSAEVLEEELYLYPPSGLHRACNGVTLFHALEVAILYSVVSVVRHHHPPSPPVFVSSVLFAVSVW